MHRVESFLESEILKILWDFEIWMALPIPERQPDLVLVNMKKRAFHLVD